MDNKILVTIYIPAIEKSYDVFIPIGRSIKSVIVLLSKSISELNNGLYSTTTFNNLYSKESGIRYEYDIIIKDSDIRNGTNLILM